MMTSSLVKIAVIGITLLDASAQAQPIFESATSRAAGPVVGARGIAFGDYDGDGRPDLFLAESTDLAGDIMLLHNGTDGVFRDRSGQIVGEISPNDKGGGCTFVDYDNDGDLDIFVPVGSWSNRTASLRNILLRNDRGVLTNVAGEAGLDQDEPSDNAVWLDFDRDGWLDLYVGQWTRGGPPGIRNRFYRNNGDGSFADIGQATGLGAQLHPTGGGSNGGMVSGDFDSDGWPDLFLGVFQDRNRLFRNSHQGTFEDITSNETSDPGPAYGIAVGDIDNDLNLDLFVAAGARYLEENPEFRPQLLLGLGGGEFLDFLEGAGLSVLNNVIAPGASLADIDNDGDLDLMVGSPFHLFLNHGDKAFTDGTEQAGVDVGGLALAVGDWDLDGFLDLVSGHAWPMGDGGQRLWRNVGNDNHWLRVELAGVASNTYGVGARITARSGDLVQMREVHGGLGFTQDEPIAHFGLGQRTMVDGLEIRWPSGQVDVLADIPADQKIRVVEGRTWSPVRPMVWLTGVDTLLLEVADTLSLVMRPELFDGSAEILSVTADLSHVGGPADLPFGRTEDGVYAAAASLTPSRVGMHDIHVTVDQQTAAGVRWSRLSRTLPVWHSADQVLFGDAPAAPWVVSGELSAVVETDATLSGEGGRAIAVGTDGPYRLVLATNPALETLGLSSLRLALHPGSFAGTMQVTMNVSSITVLVSGDADENPLDLGKPEWQLQDIPLDVSMLSRISISGRGTGTFFVDDVSLLASQPGRPPATAVLEAYESAVPAFLSLSQNHPNPFNSSTTIRFLLPQQDAVELAIYNLTGQEVVTLASGQREAGTYTLRWDGRDDGGRELASGVYLCRLQAGEQVVTRKLLLLIEYEENSRMSPRRASVGRGSLSQYYPPS